MNGPRLDINRERSSFDALNRTIEGLEARIEGLLNPAFRSTIERPSEAQRVSDALADIMGRQSMLQPAQRKALERLVSEQNRQTARQFPEAQAPGPAMEDIAATLAIIQSELARSGQRPARPDLGVDPKKATPQTSLDVLGNQFSAQFGGLERRLDDLSHALATTGSAATSQPGEDRLIARIERLSERMEALANQEAIEELKTRIDQLSALIDQYHGYRPENDISGSLADLSHKIDQLDDAGFHTKMVERLERLILRIEEREIIPSGIESRMGALEAHVADKDGYILEAARQTGQAVIAALSKEPVNNAASSLDRQALAAVASNLRALDEFSRSSESRNFKAMEGLEGSLSRMAGHLRDLDGHFAQINSPSLYPETPMPRAAELMVDPLGLTDDFADAGEGQRSRGLLKLIGSTLSGKARSDERERLAEGSPYVDIAEMLPRHITEELIEPGSGADIKRILEKVRVSKASTEETSNHDRIDIIASARRAAEAAAQTDNYIAAPIKHNPGVFHRHRATLLLAATLVLLGVLALPLIGALKNMPDTAPTANLKPLEKPRKIAAVAQKDIRPAIPSASQAILKPAANADSAKTLIKSQKIPDTPTIENIIVPALFPAPLSEAARRGDALALFEIGARYGEGRGVTLDLAQAIPWYQRAAAKGFAPAQLRLADLYKTGKGVAPDKIRAKALYLQAAGNGNIAAMHQLAVLYFTDAKPDFVSAASWFEQAASHGMGNSQYNVAILHAQGRGVARDFAKAYQWFAIAARYGDKDAAIKRDEAAEALTGQQLASAKAHVDLWKPLATNQSANSTEIPASWSGKINRTTARDEKKAVRNIQAILNNNGFDTGEPDGTLGGRTVNAIKAFQVSVGIKPTGNIDNALVRELLARNKRV